MDFLITLLSILALPVVLIWAYDKFVLAPKREAEVPLVAGTESAARPQPPLYVRAANSLLPFVLVGVVLRIGANEVFTWAKEVAVPLSWAAVPVGLWCAIDSWLLAPRRQIAAGAVHVPDPPLLRVAYAVLPVLVLAVIVRMISAETLDFSLVLLLLSLLTGAVWMIDQFFFRKPREAAAAAATPPLALPEPGTVDYARSFFPVAAIVLVVRAFIFEPFRIPSDSMMPTLLDGDFIVVNKYAYGLRLPVVNRKFIETGEPQRGDIVVFRFPPDPSVNYIKRLVGLPGDRVEVRNDRLIINGEEIPLEDQGSYADGCYSGLRLAKEKLGEHTHQVMTCSSPYPLAGKRHYALEGHPDPLPACDRKRLVEYGGGYVCNEVPGSDRDLNDHVFDVVPPGHYLMIGDNRDNSEDSRKWQFVPDQNLVGKATRIWFNFDLQRSKWVNWSRIGQGIE